MVTERQRERQIAVLMYPGVTTLELVGTASALSGLRIRTGFCTVIVAERREPMDTDTSIKLLPESTFEEVPQPFGIVVPGGAQPTRKAMSNQAIRDYVRTAAETAEIVGSVCTGALILAAVGLLEGRRAATHWTSHKILESFGATYERKRWVEDGKFITSAGVSAGIDMGLELAARLTDEASARQVQLWLDYDPQPPFGRLDYEDMSLTLRARRAATYLAAPVLTRRPKRLTRRERIAG
jgi:transcriptional regulator GlxA family with amidase domain